MGLDVETPDSPDLTNRGLPSDVAPDDVVAGESDFRRGELEDVLRDGAWNEAFLEWAEYTGLTEAEFRTVREAGLFERLDFYWDPEERRLRGEVPTLPPELAADRSLASLVTTELSDLCEMVVEMLSDGYVDWGYSGSTEPEEWRGEYAGVDPTEEG